MTVQGFVNYWSLAKDIDGSCAVGLGGINWQAVPKDSGRVLQFCGYNAWKEIGEFYAPHWGNFDRTKLKEWLNPDRKDYNKFIDEEKNKIALYDIEGLIYPLFCAISDESGRFGILADGSHRFIDCNYLIMNGKEFKNDICSVRLDVLCVPNLKEVITVDMPPQ